MRPLVSPITPAATEPINSPKKPNDRKAEFCVVVEKCVVVKELITPLARYKSMAFRNKPAAVKKRCVEMF